MKRNPYIPSAAITSEELPAEEITFLREARPRPIAVWILISVIALFLFSFLSKAALYLKSLLLHGISSSGPAGAAVAIAGTLVVTASLVLIAVCTFRGASWSRWVGVAVIVGLGIASLGSPDNSTYTNNGQRAGGFVGRYVLLPALLIGWLYAFGFSAKAKRFFSHSASRVT